MSRLLSLCALCGLIGCDDSTPPPRNESHWEIEFVVAGGSHPVISPDDSAFLFLREGAGLFLWSDGHETRITPEGLTARADYSWSASDENFFAFSYPGAPGSGGIVVSSDGGSLAEVWDRGSAPAYVAAESYLYCAGPAEVDSEAGIWQIFLPNLEKARRVQQGIAPQIFDNGALLAHLLPVAASSGGQLIVRDTRNFVPALILDHIARFATRPDTDLVVTEVIADSQGLATPPRLLLSTMTGPMLTIPIVAPATDPVLLRDGSVLFNSLTGDALGALEIWQNSGSTTVSDSLFDASANSADIIYAVGPSGISRITRRH